MKPLIVDFLSFWWPAFALAGLGLLLTFSERVSSWADQHGDHRLSAAARSTGKILRTLAMAGGYALLAVFMYVQCSGSPGLTGDEAPDCERLPSIYGC